MDKAVAIANEDPGALLTIVGPTASGKTDLAIEVATRIGAEIVSADSVQIYRGFDIGSGKPNLDELARAKHHLIDAIDPLEPFDAAAYAELANRAIADATSRGKRVIVCGGTFLWVKALLYGLAEAPAASREIRERHRDVVATLGRTALHDRLAQVDAESAARLHPNDVVRVSRALEVYELSGRTLSTWHTEHAFKTERHRSRLVAITRDTAELTARIEQRVELWLAGGWLDETRALLDRGCRDARAMTSVGYREVCAHLDGTIPRDELARSIVRSTRVFARRQRTWLNHADVVWL